MGQEESSRQRIDHGTDTRSADAARDLAERIANDPRVQDLSKRLTVELHQSGSDSWTTCFMRKQLIDAKIAVLSSAWKTRAVAVRRAFESDRFELPSFPANVDDVVSELTKEYEALLADYQRGLKWYGLWGIRRERRWRGGLSLWREYSESIGNDVSSLISRLEEQYDDWLRDVGPDDPETLHIRGSLAWSRAMAGDLGKAITEFEKLLSVQQRVFGLYAEDTNLTRGRLEWLRNLRASGERSQENSSERSQENSSEAPDESMRRSIEQSLFARLEWLRNLRASGERSRENSSEAPDESMRRSIEQSLFARLEWLRNLRASGERSRENSSEAPDESMRRSIEQTFVEQLDPRQDLDEQVAELHKRLDVVEAGLDKFLDKRPRE